MIKQCDICGNCGENWYPTARGFLCPRCANERAEFDADELGLDPETDNSPDHKERVA